MKKLKQFFASVASWLFPDHLLDEAVFFTHTSPDTLLVISKLAHTVLLPDTLAVFSYQDPKIKSMVWSLKYRNNKRAGFLLGQALALHVAEEFSERQQFGTFQTPLIIPIPLHPRRERERGYNQSLIVARAFAKKLSFPKEYVQPHTLVRTKYTESLAHGTSRKQRYEHMQSAFTIPSPDLIKNKDVILIDDVITSGATMSEAKRVLIEAGARQVLLLAIAH